MVRVVVGADGQLLIDRKGPGRGAWLCRSGDLELPRLECLARAVKRHAFARALRTGIGAVESEALLASVSERARMATTDGVAHDGGARADQERD